MVKLHFGKRGGIYYKKNGNKYYVNSFGGKKTNENVLINLKEFLENIQYVYTSDYEDFKNWIDEQLPTDEDRNSFYKYIYKHNKPFFSNNQIDIFEIIGGNSQETYKLKLNRDKSKRKKSVVLTARSLPGQTIENIDGINIINDSNKQSIYIMGNPMLSKIESTLYSEKILGKQKFNEYQKEMNNAWTDFIKSYKSINDPNTSYNIYKTKIRSINNKFSEVFKSSPLDDNDMAIIFIIKYLNGIPDSERKIINDEPNKYGIELLKKKKNISETVDLLENILSLHIDEWNKNKINNTLMYINRFINLADITKTEPIRTAPPAFLAGIQAMKKQQFGSKRNLRL